MKKTVLVLIGAMLAISCNKNFDRELQRSTSKTEAVTNFFPVKDHPTHKQGEIVVKFKPGTQKSILNKRSYRSYLEVQTATMKTAKFKAEPFYQINVPDEGKALAEFKSNPDVEYAGLNPTHTTQDIFVPNDPEYTANHQWNLGAIEADKAWASGNTGSKTVYIAVLDEGAAYWFCDYNSKVWTNDAEMNGVTGVDDDHNGHIDDYRGWNYFNGSNELYTGNDDHGTWCGSMIGAESGNNIGITSVAPNIKIIHYKFLADWGYDSEAAKAIDDIIWLKVNKGLNIVAISCSWGGGGPTPILRDAIHRAGLADISLPCASGNSNLNTSVAPSYPAAYDEPNILSVGASDQANNKAYFSNWGTDQITGVDLFAPGVNCAALIPVNHTEAIGYYSGTSMATPLVAAALGLIASVNPEMTYLQRQNALLAAVKKVSSLTQYCKSGGILNLNNAVFFGNTGGVTPDFTCGTLPNLDLKKPAPPMVLTLDSVSEDPVSGYATLYLSWTKSLDENPIIQLVFQLTPYWAWGFEGNAWTGYAFQVPMDRLYTISARAQDSWGNFSDPSNVITKDYSGAPPPTDNIPPSIPQNLRATEITTNSFRATWNPSTDNVAMKDYKIHWKANGAANWIMTFTNNATYVPNNLSENTDYTFAVMARDQADNYSDTAFVQLRTLSDTPPPPPPPSYTITSNLDGTAQGLNVGLSWTVSSNGTIQSVKLERKKGGNPFAEIASVTSQATYQDQVPNPGQWSYRLRITLTNGQVGYSNERNFKVNKR